MTFTDYAARYARMLDLLEKALDGMTCSCYDVDSMEYDPAGTCSKCQLTAIFDSETSDAA